MRTLVAACLVAGFVVPGMVSAQWGIAAEIGVARFRGSSRDTSGTTVGPYRPTTVEVRLEAGPAVQLWTVDGASRTRVAAQTAAALEWPLAGSLTGSLRVSGVLSGSIFNADEPPPEVERRATRRLGVAIGARYRL